MLSERALEMKRRLENFPDENRLRALVNEICAVQRRSFDSYIEEHAYPNRRTGTRVQTSGITDPTARLAVNGRERFEMQKRSDLKHLVTLYRREKQFHRLALLSIALLPRDEQCLITRHCVEGESITAIGLDIGLSRATAYRRYDEVVERLTDLYYQAIHHERAMAG